MVAAISLAKSFQIRHAPMTTAILPAWTLTTATPHDSSDVKTLFWKLHAFNSSLDPRFALSDDWESSFEEHLKELWEGSSARCWLVRQKSTGQACGLLIAAIHRDSALWRYREWAEVEALYIEKEWRGSGLAEELLAVADEWALAKGQSAVQLYVTATNERALRFYRRKGFQQTQAIMRKVLR